MQQDSIQALKNSDQLRKATPHLIAYFDILGYKAMVEKDDLDEDFTIGWLSREFATLFEYNIVNEKATCYCFSDNFVICIPYCTDSFNYDLLHLITFLEMMQGSIWKQLKMLVRGSVTFGNVFTGDKFLYGKGLVKAYELENHMAVYPRIIVDIDSLPILESNLEETTEIWTLSKMLDCKWFLQDFDGEYFVGFPSKYLMQYSIDLLSEFSDGYGHQLFEDEECLRIIQLSNRKFVEYIIDQMLILNNHPKDLEKWLWFCYQINLHINRLSDWELLKGLFFTQDDINYVFSDVLSQQVLTERLTTLLDLFQSTLT